MGFFNNQKSRMTSRGNKRATIGQNKRIFREMTYKNVNGARIPQYKDVLVTVTKKQSEALDLGFTAWSLKHGNIMILGDIEYMLPQYKHDIHPDIHNIIRNDMFEGIKADKIGLIYSPKLKKFLFMGLNDDYSISILFESDDYNNLPNSQDIDLDNLHPNLQIIENANSLLSTVYNVYEVYAFTSNPIKVYKINEVFKR